MSLTQYLLEFSICLVFFYGLYHFLLRRETFFQLNRWYLLISPVLSMTIPFLNWELPASTGSANWDQVVVPLVQDIQQSQIMVWERLETPATTAAPFTYLDLLLLVYLLGVVWMAYRLLYRTWRLMVLIGRSKQEKCGGYTIVTPDEQLPAASFLSYVFWEEGPLDSVRQRILEHELVHVRQWHSLDVLLMEIWVMFKWFHPLIYWYRNSLRLTHEYIADAYVSARMESRLSYAQLLLGANPASSSHQLLHHFHSSLKMRLLMLAKQQSSLWKYLKLLAILPVTGVLLSLFAFDLAGELPSPLVEPLERMEMELQDLAQRPVLPAKGKVAFEASDKTYQLKWGDIECSCSNEQFPNYYHCENQSMLPRQLRRLIRKEGGFAVYLDGVRQPLNELKAVSKYMKDMGGFQGQFDEMDKGFNTDSPLWRQAEDGDVFRFTFSNGSGDYFEFELVMNNRKTDYLFGSSVELGDYHFNINLTNERGVAHMDVEELQRLARSPLRVKKNNEAYYDLAKATIVNRNALRQDIYDHIGGEALDISPSKAITEAFPGDQVLFSLISVDGEKIEFDILLRKNSSWNDRKRDLGIQWGKLFFRPHEPLLLTMAELEALQDEDMYLQANGRRHRMQDETVDYKDLHIVDGRSIPTNRKIRGIKELIEVNRERMKPGHSLSLGHLKSVSGYLTPWMTVYIDFDWREVFRDNPNVLIKPNNTLVIEPATPADLETLIHLEGFQRYFYEIQVDGEVVPPSTLISPEQGVLRKGLGEIAKEQQLPQKRLVVSRLHCLNCRD